MAFHIVVRPGASSYGRLKFLGPLENRALTQVQSTLLDFRIN